MRLVKWAVTLSTIGAGILGMSGRADAQCFAWACNGADVRWSNPGSLRRVQINTNDLTSSNSGIQWQINGAGQWSLATANIGSIDIPIYTLDLYNDQSATLALRAYNSGRIETRQVRPQIDNHDKLGDTSFRWTAVYAVNGSIQTSDGRQKKNVADLKYGLNEVLKLRPVTFNWKAGPDGKTHLGLIAQEVEKLVPEAVAHGEKPSDPLGMNYSDFVPILIKAIQTQQKTIENQSERITKLEKGSGLAATVGSKYPSKASLAFLALPALGAVAFARRRRHTGKK